MRFWENLKALLISNLKASLFFVNSCMEKGMDYSITGHGTPMILNLEVGIPGPKL